MEISKYLREYSRTIHGKQQLIVGAFAKALEVIPRQLCDNAGFDATDILNKLRQKHAKGILTIMHVPDVSLSVLGGTWFGVDVTNEDIEDNMNAFVWEPALVKTNALAAATEAACLILSVDETVKNPQSEQPGNVPMRGAGARGRGVPRR
jgi:T-complex protein 1 subunit eta